jgi:hypothetical protein
MKERFIEVMKAYWKYWFPGILLSILIPIGINFLMRVSIFPDLQFGKTEEWLAFFGNYAGAGAGVVIAMIVSMYQVAENKKSLQKQLDIEHLHRKFWHAHSSQIPLLANINH